MKRCSCLILLLGVIITLLACGAREGLAPVEELKWIEINQSAKYHTVRRGETLYAIAFRYDQDYHQLARLNHLSSPYALRIGQVIRLQPYLIKPKLQISSRERFTFSSKHSWIWPVHGRVVSTFSPQKGQKGITISGKKGEKIHAAASGVVAYAGNGLPGYGNLIILKHDNQYLTAYANNQRNLVHEGQYVQKGAVIAEMGMIDRRFWGLHFEIRKLGAPINPLHYLQKA